MYFLNTQEVELGKKGSNIIPQSINNVHLVEPTHIISHELYLHRRGGEDKGRAAVDEIQMFTTLEPPDGPMPY